MRLRQFIRTCAASAALTLAAGAYAPGMAQESPEPGTAPAGPDQRPDWRAGHHHPSPPYAVDPRARDEWLAECRRRISSRDDGVGGAVIGGVIGGIAGNRIAGRGNRTEGTIAGAAVGAAVGMAIDKAEDKGRARDECETYLDDYYAYYGGGGYGYPGYGHAAYGYGHPASGCCYGGPVMMVPIMRMSRPKPGCREVVEYVEVPGPGKRIKVVPDKRIRK